MCVYVSAEERKREKEREEVGKKEHALARKKLTENEFEREEGRKGERQRVCECVYLRVCVFVYVYTCVFVNVGVCVCVCWHYCWHGRKRRDEWNEHSFMHSNH